jgi:hypothetical protein
LSYEKAQTVKLLKRDAGINGLLVNSSRPTSDNNLLGRYPYNIHIYHICTQTFKKQIKQRFEHTCLQLIFLIPIGQTARTSHQIDKTFSNNYFSADDIQMYPCIGGYKWRSIDSVAGFANMKKAYTLKWDEVYTYSKNHISPL